jgi:serine/threonine-protein kinase
VVSGISAELDTVIMKALAKSVKDRYNTAVEFINDLDKILAGQTIIWDQMAIEEGQDLTQVHKGLRDKLTSADPKGNLEDTLHKGDKKKKCRFLPDA